MCSHVSELTRRWLGVLSARLAETEFEGEIWAATGIRIGFLPREPQLDPELDVKGSVDLAVAEQRELLQRLPSSNRMEAVRTAEGIPIHIVAGGGGWDNRAPGPIQRSPWCSRS